MHVQCIRSMDRQLITEEDTFQWLSRGDLKGETESEIIAAQDQALQTKQHATQILQTERDSTFRLCKQFDETVEHIVSASPILTKEQHIKRHDTVCAQLHFNVCKEIGVKLDNKHWYDHVPKSAETRHEVKDTKLWNQQMRTDRHTPNNKPHIVIHDNKKRTRMLNSLSQSVILRTIRFNIQVLYMVLKLRYVLCMDELLPCTSLTDGYFIIEVESVYRAVGTESIYKRDYVPVLKELVDITKHEEKNLIKKEAAKTLKYKDLIIEFQHMWNVEAKLILVIIGTTGTISRSLRRYLSNTPGKHEIKELQKTVILGTASLHQKVLMFKYNTCFMSEITFHVAQIANTEQLKHSVP